MLRAVLRKKQGSGDVLSNAVIFSLAFIFIYLIGLCLFDCAKKSEQLNEINRVARHYKNLMETHGVLSYGEEAAMIRQLEKLGVISIDVSGNIQSDRGKAEWGEEVLLCIVGEITELEIHADEFDKSTLEKDTAFKIVERGISYK